MCKGSVHAAKTVDAQAGVSYQVSDGGHPGYKIGVLHEPRHGRTEVEGPISCAACIRAPTTVTLSGLTPEMQELYKVGPTADAVFVPNEAAPANMQDVIEFASDVRTPLIAFAGSPVRITIAVQAEQQTTERRLAGATV